MVICQPSRLWPTAEWVDLRAVVQLIRSRQVGDKESVALAMFRLDDTKGSVPTRQCHAALDDEYRIRIISILSDTKASILVQVLGCCDRGAAG